MYRFPLRDEVHKANARRLASLSGNGHRYIAADSPGYNELGKKLSVKEATVILDRLVAPREVTLKVHP